MYECCDCGKVFEKPLEKEENFGVVRGFTAVNLIAVCPYCESDTIMATKKTCTESIEDKPLENTDDKGVLKTDSVKVDSEPTTISEIYLKDKKESLSIVRGRHSLKQLLGIQSMNKALREARGNALDEVKNTK